MRGLLMVECLYHQTIAGNKTMTRRSGGLDEVNKLPDNWEITGHTGEEDKLEEVDFCDCMDTQRNIYCKPRYKVGEVLYLKEPTHTTHLVGAGSPKKHTIYAFDYSQSYRKMFKWSNKLFMTASAAREFVRITGIKCERLLDISDEDCIAEGIEHPSYYPSQSHMDSCYWRDYQSPLVKSFLPNWKAETNKFVDKKKSFLSLYRFANKMKPTTEIPNLWVWVYSYEYLKDYKVNQ